MRTSPHWLLPLLALTASLGGCPSEGPGAPEAESPPVAASEASGETAPATGPATEGVAPSACERLAEELERSPTRSPDIDALRSRLENGTPASAAEALMEISAHGSALGVLASEVETIAAGDDPVLRRIAWRTLLSIEPEAGSDAALQQWRGSRDVESRHEAARALATASDASLGLLVGALSIEGEDARTIASSALVLALENPRRVREIVFEQNDGYCAELEPRACRVLFRRLGFVGLVGEARRGHANLLRTELALQEGEDMFAAWMEEFSGPATLPAARAESALELVGVVPAESLWEPMLSVLTTPGTAGPDRMHAGAWLLENSARRGADAFDTAADETGSGAAAVYALLRYVLSSGETGREGVEALLAASRSPELAGDASIALAALTGAIPANAPAYVQPVLQALAGGLEDAPALSDEITSHEARLIGALIPRLADPELAGATVMTAYEESGDVRWLETAHAAGLSLSDFELGEPGALNGATLPLLVALHDLYPERIASEMDAWLTASAAPRVAATGLRAAVLLDLPVNVAHASELMMRRDRGLMVDLHGYRWWAARALLRDDVGPDIAVDWLEGVDATDGGYLEGRAAASIVAERQCQP